MLLRPPVHPYPEEDRYGTEHSCGNEGGLPTEVQDNPGDDKRGKGGSQVGAGVEYAGRECAFFLRKPLCHGLDSRREVAGFTNAKRHARDAESKRRSRQSMCGGGKAPNPDR